MDNNNLKVIVVIIVVIALIFFVIKIEKLINKNNEIEAAKRKLIADKLNEKILSLKLDYENSLKGTDKIEALKKGREYYSFLRSIKNGDNRGPSIYDETSMANDISTMNEIN